MDLLSTSVSRATQFLSTHGQAALARGSKFSTWEIVSNLMRSQTQMVTSQWGSQRMLCYMIPCWNIEQGLGTNGLWIGAIISQSNPTLQTALTATSLLYSYVSDPSDQVTADLRQDDAFTDSYILRNRGKLSEAHQFVCQLLKKNSIEYTVGCNAGFFVWINLGRRYQEQNPMTRPAPS